MVLGMGEWGQFFNFLDFQLTLDWQKNSKTKVAKAFLFIFRSSCPEMNV
jgi:hypothetical protein